MYILDINTEHCIYCTLTQNTVYTEHQHRTMYILETRLPENHRSVGPDRQKCSRTNDLKIYISDRMSGKTYDIWKDRRLKFIPSQVPLPMALNSVFSFIKMSDRDLKFVYLFCQTDTFLFVIETPIRKCKHPFSRNQHLQNVEY